MDYIIQTDENAKHMIYTMGRHIIMRRLQAESVSQPRLLAGDYSSSLCAVFFDHSIYYAYITVNNSFCVRCTSSHAPLLLLDSGSHLLQGKIAEPAGIDDLQPESLNEMENKDTLQSNLITELEKKNTSQSELINELEKKNTTQAELITNLQEDKDNLQQACNLMMNKISALLEENESNKKALSIRDSQIESAKSQYNDLMIVAEKYRDEAAKWRNMVIS